MQVSPNPILKSGLALAAVAAVAVAVSAALSGVHAQNQEAQSQDDEVTREALPSSYAQFQYATITGSNNVLNVTMLPVVTPTGVVYKNLTIPVTAEASGAIILGTPSEVNAQQILASTFKAGKYSGPSSVNAGKNAIAVAGPGVVTGGNTVWSLTSAASTTECTYPASATWYVGPPTSTSNPNYARLKKAGITSPAYSYGVAGNTSNSSTCNPNDAWSGGTLIGVSQTGNSITITSFSTLGFSDSATPKDQITYTLQ